MTQFIESLLSSSLTASGGPRLRRTSQLLSLEQRFMFDGAAAVDATHAAQAPDVLPPPTPPAAPAVTVREAEPAKDNGKKEVVLVDTSLVDYKTLEAGIREGVGIVEFDGSKDGLAQIAAWASTQSGLDAIHILSHGSQGTLSLGTAQLNEAALADASTQAELAQLGQALSADGDLLLYGCDVATNLQGQRFINDLASATGADVAASSDATGNAARGGDWTLEYSSGSVEATALAVNDYQRLLSSSTFDFETVTPGTISKSVAQMIGSDTLLIESKDEALYVDSELNAFAFNAANASGVVLATGQGGMVVETQVSFMVAGGKTFDLSSFTLVELAPLAQFITLTTDKGSETFALNFVNSSYVVNLAAALHPSYFIGVTNVVITTTDAGGQFAWGFDNIVLSNIIDPNAPPSTTVAGASLQQDNGISTSDFITNVAAQTISGTLSTGLVAGESVEVSFDGGSSWINATSSVGSSDWSVSTTLSGSNTFVARVTNANGSSTPYTHTYTYDNVAPTISVGSVAFSNDSGSSSSDFLTNNPAQTITATLSAPRAGTDVVLGSIDNGTTWVNITSKVSGTSLSWNGVTLGASSTLLLKVQDLAGNDGPVASQSFTLDTTAPTISFSDISFSNDTGTSSTDFITSNPSQTISATLSALPAGSDLVWGSLDNGATWTDITSKVSGTTLTWNGVTLASSNTLRLRVVDAAGNNGASTPQAYVLDNTAPTISFDTVRFSADTGVSSTDLITSTASQTINAHLSAAPAGSDLVWGSLDNGTTWTDITSQVSGTSLSWAGVTLIGSNTLQLRVTDAAGNIGSSSSVNYTFDNTAPVTPGTPTLAAGSDTGQSNNDRVTSDNTPTLSGTAENGSTVSIYDGATLLGTTVAGSGGWVFTTGTLSSGMHTFSATATDTAGNVSAFSAGLAVTIDTSAPAVGSVTVPVNGTYYSSQALDFTVNFDEAVIVDTGGGTPSIAVVVGATTRYADYLAGSGTSTLTFRYVVLSGDVDSNGITVGALSRNGATIRDVAGNDAVVVLNSVGSTAAVLVDGSQPSVTSVSASSADGAYGSGSTITITVDFSSAVTVDTSGGTPTLALDSGGLATYTGGSGSSALTFSYTVAAGQNSVDLDYSSSSALALNGATIVDAGGSHQNAALLLASPGTAGSLGANKDLLIDTSAPTNTADSVRFSADSGTSNSDLITKNAAQTIDGTLATNLAAGESVYVSLDNGANWVQASASVGSNGWTLSGQTLSGSGTLKVRISDAAGNSGGAYTRAYVLDTTAPTITFSDVGLSVDSGVPGDLITNTPAQTISATLSAAPAAGDVVYGSLDNGATWTDISSKVSGTTLTWDGVTLAASNTLRLRVTDAAGNDGAATSQAYGLDTSGPTTSVASVTFSADSGASNSDFITKTAAQTISGMLSANLLSGETVYVSLDNGATWSAATAAVGDTSWSLAGQTLTASDTLQVKVTDRAGNDGALLVQGYVYDTAATLPVVDATQSPSLTPVLTGSATLAAGETLTVSVGGATYDVVPVAGAWSLDLATAVPASGALTLALNQRYSVVATVTDLAGNTANDSSSGELIVGTLATPANFQTPPVYAEPLQPIAQPVSLLPPAPSVVEQSATPPLVDVAGDRSWQSPTLFSQALRPEALLNGGLVELLSPGSASLTPLLRTGEVLAARLPIDNVVLASGARIALQLNAETFMHSIPGQNVQLSAGLADGRPLPSWLRFNPRDGRFEGVPPPGFSGKLIVRVIARDGLGHEASQQFEIVIGNRQAGLSPAPAHLADAAGRSSLSQQLHDARNAGGNRLASLAVSAGTGGRLL